MKKYCLLGLLILFWCAASGIAQAQKQYNFAIEPGPLTAVLKAYNSVTGIQVTCPNEMKEAAQSNGLHGTWPADQALGQLLKGTGLVISFIGPDSAVLKKSLADPQTPEADLGTLLVHGKHAQDFDNTLPQVDSFSALDLEKGGATDIRTSTRYIPGVSVLKGRKRGQSAGFNIRGVGTSTGAIGPNRIVMTIDGERLPDFFDFGHEYSRPMISGRDNVEFDTIKRMDIIKGPQSAKYGNDGIGGTVNFRTYEPQDFVSDTKKWYAGAKYRYRSANREHKESITLAGKKSFVTGMLIATKTDSRETYSYKKTEPWHIVGRRRRHSQDPQWIDGHNILTKFHFGNDLHRISLVGEKYFKEHDTMLLASGEGRVSSKTGLNRSQGSLDTVRRRRISLGYRFQPHNSWLDTLNFKIYNQNLHNSDELCHIHNRLPQEEGYPSKVQLGDYRQNIWAVKTDINGHLDTSSMRHEWSAGIQYRWEKSVRDDIHWQPDTDTFKPQKWLPDMRTDTLALYVQDAISFPFGLTITPALRYEKWRYRPTADSDYLNSVSPDGAKLAEEDMDNTNLSPKLRISYAFTNYLTGYGSIAYGGKNPPLLMINGMVDHGPFPVLPGTGLKPEKTRNYETGLLYNSPHLDISLVGFYNFYRDMFAYDVVFDLPVYGFGLVPRNCSKMEIYGGEAAITWRFMPNWHVQGSVSYAKGKHIVSDFNPIMQEGMETNLYGTGPMQGVISIGYSNKRYGLNLTSTISDEYDLNRALKVPGYALFDMTGWWKINDHLELTAGIYNILNKKYWEGLDILVLNRSSNNDVFTMPGLNFNVGLKFHF